MSGPLDGIPEQLLADAGTRDDRRKALAALVSAYQLVIADVQTLPDALMRSGDPNQIIAGAGWQFAMLLIMQRHAGAKKALEAMTSGIEVVDRMPRGPLVKP